MPREGQPTRCSFRVVVLDFFSCLRFFVRRRSLMKYLAAYLLAALTGEPTEKSVTAIVTAAGGEADAAKVSALFAELSGKSLDEIIAAGAPILHKPVLISTLFPCCSVCGTGLCLPFHYYHLLFRPFMSPFLFHRQGQDWLCLGRRPGRRPRRRRCQARRCRRQG
jgi:hypothetical protein